MPFICPLCFSSGSLNIQKSMQLAPDNRSDDIMLQLVKCSQCGFSGAAVYEESRWGALQTESWEHTGYELEPGDLEWIGTTIDSCPSPSDPACRCSSHQALGRHDGHGRWLGLERFHAKRTFHMVLAG